MNEDVPFTFRLKFPVNYSIPAHSHPAIERVTVLSGTFHMGTGDRLDSQKTMPLSPGDVMIMQPKTNHFAWTKEEVVVQLNGMGPWVTYVNPLTIRERSARWSGLCRAEQLPSPRG
jgi:anti-sigma factor ChrR (cupin superfamily)